MTARTIGERIVIVFPVARIVKDASDRLGSDAARLETGDDDRACENDAVAGQGGVEPADLVPVENGAIVVQLAVVTDVEFIDRGRQFLSRYRSDADVRDYLSLVIV